MIDHAALLATSVEVILDHQAPSGAYVACPDFSPYRYSWFRDGAFIAEAMSRVGRSTSADRFHHWCARIIADRGDTIEQLVGRHERGETIAPTEHLHTRYTLDGNESDEPWWTFQLDGYGTWLWALDRHLDRHGASPAPYLDAVNLVVRYLMTFWDQPCYDWWEEHPDRIHTATLGSIAAGLRAAVHWDQLPAELTAAARDTVDAIVDVILATGTRDGSLVKWLDGDAVDASLVATFVPFGIVPADGPVAAATIGRIEDELAPAGVHRYRDDVYYGGGEWVLLAGFLGSYHAAVGDRRRARELLDWMAAQADRDGRLPEQVTTHLLHPDHEQRWIQRWGPSARPLLWSHAMLLTLADDLDLTEALERMIAAPRTAQEMA